MPDREQRLATTLARAKDVHGVVAQRTGGADPEWALFYAWWLINWSDLPELLGATPGLGELTARLVSLDAAYRSVPRDQAWPEFYARDLLTTAG